MAKVVVTGNAVVVTSSMGLEDIKKVKKYKPEALSVYKDDEKKEEIFKVDASNNPDNAGFSPYGVTFVDATRNEEKKAIITLTLPNVPEGACVNDVVADKFGAAIKNLIKIEEGFGEALASVEAERKAVFDSIQVVE